MIGSDPKTVGNWCRINDDPEQTSPTAAFLARLCDALDVSVDWLLGRTDCVATIAPGAILVGVDEERRPTAEDAVVAVRVPQRFDVVADEAEVERRVAEARERWSLRHRRKKENQQ
jgi:transcriptional regulator with XRE-family HTH domain